jgi:hypothetical protein
MSFTQSVENSNNELNKVQTLPVQDNTAKSATAVSFGRKIKIYSNSILLATAAIIILAAVIFALIYATPMVISFMMTHSLAAGFPVSFTYISAEILGGGGSMLLLLNAVKGSTRGGDEFKFAFQKIKEGDDATATKWLEKAKSHNCIEAYRILEDNALRQQIRNNNLTLEQLKDQLSLRY